MSSNRTRIVAFLALAFGCAAAQAGGAHTCPSSRAEPLRFVDVFDGPPEELATLVPDESHARTGSWRLGYVYDAGRFVTIRCKYSGGKSVDVKLQNRVGRCVYKLDSRKVLSLVCK